MINRNSNTTFEGTPEAELLQNYPGTENVTILGNGGADTIQNIGGTNISIVGGADNDNVYNGDNNGVGGNNITIETAEGNDSVDNRGTNVSIDSGANDDFILNYGNDVTVASGAGNDSIQNTGSNAIISGGEDSDTINNFASNVSIDAGDGNDVITNSEVDSVTVNAGEGDNEITNWSTNALLLSGDGNDAIQNLAANVSIDTRAGNDYIENGGSNVSISAGADNDTISNTGDNVFVGGGAGNDSVGNSGNATTVLGGIGEDIIQNTGNAVAINAGADNDVISSNGAQATLDGGDGNDTIDNYGNDSSVLGGIGDDSINNSGSNTVIDTDEGNDSVYSRSSATAVTVNTGAGDDTIENFASNITIDLGADNDSLYSGNRATSVTADAGAGNDNITNWSASSSIAGGEGSDTVSNYGNDSTILGGSGEDSIQNGGVNVLVDAGEGNDAIINHQYDNQNGVTISPENVTLEGGDGNDTIDNQANNVTISGGANNDSIYSQNDFVSIDGGAGDDDILNKLGNNVTIAGGEGNDSVGNSGSNISISGDAGDDYIRNGIERIAEVTLSSGETFESLVVDSGENVTLGGGKGNNTLTGSRFADVYVYEGGNDVITNYSGEDTIQIAAGSIDANNVSVEGNDLIFTIGDGSLRLKNTRGHYITFATPDGTTTTQLYGSTGYSTLEVIQNLVQAWNKTFLNNADRAKLDEAIRQSSQFNNIQEVIDKMISDCRTAGDAETFLREKCGIILDNPDTGAISGWDAGNASVQSSDEIIGENPPPTKNISNYYDFTFTTKQGVKIHINLPSGYVLDNDSKKVLDGLYNWWADESIDLVERIYGFKFGEDKEIEFTLVKDGQHWGLTETVQGNSNKNIVTINMGQTTFDGTEDYNGNHVDRCIAHEFTHVAQNFFMGHFVQFLEEGLAEVTHGIDDERTILINDFAGNADSLSTYLDLAGEGTGSTEYYAAGYMFYRYFTKQAADDYSEEYPYVWKDGLSIVGTSDADFLTGSGKNQTLMADSGNDTITAYGEAAEISAGDDDDKIYSGGSKSKINAGTGNDSIYNSGSDVTLSGGTGNDVISLSSDANNNWIDYSMGDGNDTILGFNANSTLRIFGDLKNSIKWGDDTVLVMDDDDKSSVTLSGTSGKVTIVPQVDISLKSGNDRYTVAKDGVKVYALAGNDSITNAKTNVTVIGGAGNDSINNSGADFVADAGEGDDTVINEASNALLDAGDDNDVIDNKGNGTTITGGSGKDSIANTGSNVTVDAGTGDDTLTNDGGANVFVDYRAGDGNDLIEGFNETSKLRIGEGNSSYLKMTGDTDVIIMVGDNNVTLSGAASLVAVHVDGQIPTTVLTDKNSSPLTLSDMTANADATARTKAIRITGNVFDNTILGSKGNDTLYGGNGEDSLVGGAGNDKLYGQNGNDTLYGGAGNDTLTGDAGNDWFVHDGGNDVIDGYVAGEDKISLGADITRAVVTGSNAIFTTAKGKLTVKDGKDKELTYIDVNGNEVTEKIRLKWGDSSANSIVNTLEGATIQAFAGNDTISNSKLATSVSVDAGAGDDSITNNGAESTLLGGAGNDIINNNGSNVTVIGGKDDDTITNKGNYVSFVYSEGDGNDLITGFKVNSTLRIGDGTGNYDLIKSDNDIIITVGDAEVTLKDAASLSKVNVEGTLIVPDPILHLTDDSAAAVTLDSRYDGAEASIRSNPIKITGNEKENSIVSGNGNDTLYGKDGSDKLYGGAGNDKLYGQNGDDTLYGGAGNDTLTGDAGNDWFIYDGGNDVIDGYVAGEDKISLGADITRAVVTGSNAIFTTAKGKLTVKDGKDKDITYINLNDEERTEKIRLKWGDSSANSIVNTLEGATIQAFAGNDTISNSKLATSVSVDAGAGDDSITNNGAESTLLGGAGNDIINNNGSNVTVIGGKDDDTITNKGNYVSFVYSEGDGNDLITGFKVNSTLRIGDGTGNYDSIKSDNDIIITVGDAEVTLKDAASLSKVNVEGTLIVPDPILHLTDDSAAAVTLDSRYDGAEASIRSNPIKITGNEKENSIVGGNGNDTLYGKDGSDKLYGGAGNDKLYGQNGDDTLWSGLGNDTLTGDAGNDWFIYEGGNDVIADYVAGEDKISLGADITRAVVTGSNAIFTTAKGKLTVKDGKDKELTYIDANGNEVTEKIRLKWGDSSANSIVNTLEGATIQAFAGSDTISNSKLAASVSVDAGAGDDSITNNGAESTLLGGAGNDSINNNGSNVTVIGGKDDDTITNKGNYVSFVYSEGDGSDIINGFKANSTLRIGSDGKGSYSSTVSGDDVVVTIGDGAVTLTGAASLSAVNIEGTLPKPPRTILTLTDKNSASVTAPSKYDDVDASTRTKEIRIKGNSKDNSILGGVGNDTILGNTGADSINGNDGDDKLYGDAGDDILIGGAGNDSLWGDDGADTFIYNNGDGKDVIYGFDDDDMIQITGTFTTAVNAAGSLIYFKVGSTAGALTLKEFTATTFNINGSDYKINDKKLEKQ